MEPLVIPVTSAGKILSAIDDRIDGSLAALRAGFNRIELPALMRNRLIALAIDGFDELSDSRGYDNSWSALRELISEVGAESLIILSGRDSFIGIDTLKNLIGTSVNLVGSHLHSIKIDFPSGTDAANWVASVNGDWETRVDELKDRLEHYYWLRRPFFVSQISKSTPDAFLNSGDEPIVSLCDDIVGREVDKLGIPNSVAESTGKRIVYSILTEAARTMVDYEIDHVDAALLEVAVELACEEHVPGNDDFRRALTARAKTLTLLEPAFGTGDKDNRAFPHEKVKAFFYSQHLLSELSENGLTPLGLRRSQLTISDISVFRALLSLESVEFSVGLSNNIGKLLNEHEVASTAFSNLVAIGLACSSDLPRSRPFAVSGGAVVDAVVVEKPVLSLRHLYINKLDVTEADLTFCEFDDCEVGDLIVSPITKFGPSSPSVNTLIFQSSSGSESVYRNQDEISAIVGGRESEKEAAAALEIPDTLAILARMMLKSHWVRLSKDDKRGRRLVDRSDWEVIRDILEDAGYLEIKNIGAGGRPDEFTHLRNAEQFLNPGTDNGEIRATIEKMIEAL